MDIQFENANARQIYDRVLSHTSSVAKKKAEELFGLAARDDYNDETLSAEEAAKAEKTLQRYDQGLLNQLKITFYTADEVNGALAEYKAWDDIFEYNSKEEAIAKLKAFIEKYPDSPNASRSCFILAQNYYEDDWRIADAISMYEYLAEKYPQTVDAHEALRQLASLYNMAGEEEKRIACIERWLKIPPYQPYGHYGPAPKYENVAKGMKLMRAEHSSGAGSYFAQAQYFLYEKQDLARAEQLIRKAMEIDKGMPAEKREEELECVLAEIAFRKAGSLSQALQVYAGFKASGKIGNYLRYRGGGIQINEDIPAEIYFLALLLNNYSGVKEVRLFSYLKLEPVDAETKMPKNYYFLMYKTADGWQMADESGPGSAEKLGLKQKDLAEIVASDQTVVIEGATITQQAIQGEKLFAASLAEFHSIDEIWALDTVGALYRAHLSADEQKMTNRLFLKLKNDAYKKKKLPGFTKAYLLLPPFLYDGLKEIKFDLEDERWGGSYREKKRLISLVGEDGAVFTHELGHHWDLALARGENNTDLNPGDPSLLFYRISWLNWSNWSNGSAFQAQYRATGSDYEKYAMNFLPQGWQRRPEAKADDFAKAYGLADGFEDFATSLESYYTGINDLRRGKIRAEMKKGNFETALKYLFIKYIPMFDPADGLCYEYNLSEDDSPLNFSEVRHAMAQWEKKDPKNKVPEHLKQIIDEIETKYLKRKVQSGYDLG